MLSAGWVGNVRDYLNKNRGRIAFAAIAVIAVSAYYHYTSSAEVKAVEECNVENAEVAKSTSKVAISEVISNGIKDDDDDAGMHNTKMLIKIRSQFDTAALHFLPTLRMKIFEIVDIELTVRKLKDLRSSTIADKMILEDDLWNELKISSFTVLFVTAYMLSSVCVLIRIQLHVIAKSLLLEAVDLESIDDIFSSLIEKTFQHVMGAGLATFSNIVRNLVTDSLRSWVVKEKLNVTFQEVMEIIAKMRKLLETDFASLISTMIIPPDNAQFQSSIHKSVQKMLHETWDLAESPMFHAAVSESLNSCFKLVCSQLRRNVFVPDSNPNSHATLRTLPLASLLPQVKAIAGRLLPTHAGQSPSAAVLSAELKEVSSGPIIDGLCISIFNSQNGDA